MTPFVFPVKNKTKQRPQRILFRKVTAFPSPCPPPNWVTGWFLGCVCVSFWKISLAVCIVLSAGWLSLPWGTSCGRELGPSCDLGPPFPSVLRVVSLLNAVMEVLFKPCGGMNALSAYVKPSFSSRGNLSLLSFPKKYLGVVWDFMGSKPAGSPFFYWLVVTDVSAQPCKVSPIQTLKPKPEIGFLKKKKKRVCVSRVYPAFYSHG